MKSNLSRYVWSSIFCTWSVMLMFVLLRIATQQKLFSLEMLVLIVVMAPLSLFIVYMLDIMSQPVNNAEHVEHTRRLRELRAGVSRFSDSGIPYTVWSRMCRATARAEALQESWTKSYFGELNREIQHNLLVSR